MVLSAALGLLAGRGTTDTGSMKHHRQWQSFCRPEPDLQEALCGGQWEILGLSLILSILNWNMLYLHGLAKDGGCCKADSFCPSSWCFLPMVQMRTERPSEVKKPTQSQISDTCRLRFNFWGSVGTFPTSVADSVPKVDATNNTSGRTDIWGEAGRVNKLLAWPCLWTAFL